MFGGVYRCVVCVCNIAMQRWPVQNKVAHHTILVPELVLDLVEMDTIYVSTDVPFFHIVLADITEPGLHTPQ